MPNTESGADGDLLVNTPSGLWCEAGDFWIDPERPVSRAVITHGHADHARRGSEHYLTARPGKHVVRLRIGPRCSLEGIEYGETFRLGDTRVSFHPAGHMLGSAQVRVERGGEVWVVSGDYKLDPDPTCRPFETLRSDVFITEASFARPEFRWQPCEEVLASMADWWRENREAGRASIVFAYPAGKSQRVIAALGGPTESNATGPIYTHDAIERVNEAYRRGGVELPPTRPLSKVRGDAAWSGSLIVLPPHARGTRRVGRFGPESTALVTGWAGTGKLSTRLRCDREFPLSDHADWDGILRTIEATGARRVLVTHGSTAALVTELERRGIAATAIPNRWEE